MNQQIIDAVIVSERPRKTRAQVMRDRVQVRLAVGDEAGPLIAEILKENGIELPGTEWSGPLPHWLIACDNDEVIGCLQVMPAKPVSHCEFLCVKPSISFKLRAIAIRKLMLQGLATAYHAGASYVACNVSASNKQFLGVVEKHMTKMSERTLFVKKLT